MGTPNQSVLRASFFTQELNISLKLIKSGLAHLQNNELYKQEHFVYLILISGGLERFTKIVLYLLTWETEGRYLTKQELHKWGHNLEAITDQIVTKCFTPPYTERPFANSDMDFLTQDQSFRCMLTLLTKFAKKDRYIYMDGISNPSSFTESPEMLWEEFQRATLAESDKLQSFGEQRIIEHVQKLNHNTIICIERMILCLARLFIFNVLGTEGKKFGPSFRQFSFVNDEGQIGKTIYQF